MKCGGSEKVLAMLKGGHKMFWGSFSHIEGGRKKFPLFKRGARKVVPCLDRGGGRNFSHLIIMYARK